MDNVSDLQNTLPENSDDSPQLEGLPIDILLMIFSDLPGDGLVAVRLSSRRLRTVIDSNVARLFRNYNISITIICNVDELFVKYSNNVKKKGRWSPQKTTEFTFAKIDGAFGIEERKKIEDCTAFYTRFVGNIRVDLSGAPSSSDFGVIEDIVGMANSLRFDFDFNQIPKEDVYWLINARARLHIDTFAEFPQKYIDDYFYSVVGFNELRLRFFFQTTDEQLHILARRIDLSVIKNDFSITQITSTGCRKAVQILLESQSCKAIEFIMGRDRLDRSILRSTISDEKISTRIYTIQTNPPTIYPIEVLEVTFEQGNGKSVLTMIDYPRMNIPQAHIAIKSSLISSRESAA